MSKKLIAEETWYYVFFLYKYEDNNKIQIGRFRQLWELENYLYLNGYSLEDVDIVFYKPGEEPAKPIGYVRIEDEYKWRNLDRND
jgi:hypothetical protein